MRGLFSFLGFLASILLILVGFQLWGDHQRARDWWFFAGTKDWMAFADLLHSQSNYGHMLMYTPSDSASGVPEFYVVWDCSKKLVALPHVWLLRDDMSQIERQAGEATDGTLHPPRNAIEVHLLDLVCASAAQRAKLSVLRIRRDPIETAKDAYFKVARGMQPRIALMEAAK